jgi:hypothetical protein
LQIATNGPFSTSDHRRCQPGLPRPTLASARSSNPCAATALPGSRRPRIAAAAAPTVAGPEHNTPPGSGLPQRSFSESLVQPQVLPSAASRTSPARPPVIPKRSWTRLSSAASPAREHPSSLPPPLSPACRRRHSTSRRRWDPGGLARAVDPWRHHHPPSGAGGMHYGASPPTAGRSHASPGSYHTAAPISPTEIQPPRPCAVASSAPCAAPLGEVDESSSAESERPRAPSTWWSFPEKLLVSSPFPLYSSTTVLTEAVILLVLLAQIISWTSANWRWIF